MKPILLLIAAVLVAAGCGPDNMEPADDAVASAPVEITAENHDAVMEQIVGTPKHEIREIGILVYPGVNDLDVIGPKYVLAQILGARTRLVSTVPGEVTTVMGTRLVPDVTTAEVDSLDILVVPGGFSGTIEAVYDEGLHDWIRRVDATTTYTAGVCTGSWVLASTGLLDGRRATTNWHRAEERLAPVRRDVHRRAIHTGRQVLDLRWSHGRYGYVTRDPRGPLQRELRAGRYARHGVRPGPTGRRRQPRDDVA
ncbi:MAG: DJ-1/PfpI family protein [Bacteroidota bacterium]